MDTFEEVFAGIYDSWSKVRLPAAFDPIYLQGVLYEFLHHVNVEWKKLLKNSK